MVPKPAEQRKVVQAIAAHVTGMQSISPEPPQARCARKSKCELAHTSSTDFLTKLPEHSRTVWRRANAFIGMHKTMTEGRRI